MVVVDISIIGERRLTLPSLHSGHFYITVMTIVVDITVVTDRQSIAIITVRRLTSQTLSGGQLTFTVTLRRLTPQSFGGGWMTAILTRR
jgi:hypothetical protein